MENESGNKLETRIMIGVLLLVAGLNGAGTITPNSEQIVTACYGSDPNCDFYSLECNSSARILLGTLQYGSKNDSVCRDTVQSPNKPGHCNHTVKCCTYQKDDCAMEDFTREDTYKVYYNCSGKEMCMNIQSPWALLQTCSQTTYSSYVTLQYKCIKDSSIMQMNEESSMTLNSTFIQFDATRNISISSTSRNCSCEIVGVGNDSNNITVEIKDVRLSRLISVNNITNCSSARLFIGDSFQESCNRNASHDFVNFVNGKRLYFNVTSNSTLRIRLDDLFLGGEEDIPAMVWLYIEALSPINVLCNSQPPSPLTTIVPTATTLTTETTILDATTNEAVGGNESSISTQTSFRTTWNSSDTTLLSTTFGETTYHTNVNDNITTLSTTSSSPTTNTLNVTSQVLNSTSGTNQTQSGLNGAGTITPNSEQIVTACYGSDPNCDFYSLECNSSARILLGTLQYGSKNDSVCRDNVQSPNKPDHCNHTVKCCTYQKDDCAMEDFTREDTYKAYYNCSGKEMCMNIQSPWALLQTCSQTTYSSYVTLQYKCIKDSSIMQMNEESSMTLNSSFIQFDATRNISISSTSRNCSCEIVGVGNDSNNITVEIKDVRLSRHVSVNNRTICSSARLFIGDSFQESCNWNASHDYENFVNGKRLYFDVTSNSTLRIRLEDMFSEGEEDIPAMVWLYIEALSPINISCNLQPPSPLTTLVPTATTSTTATTATTSTTATTILDVTTNETVGANESSISTQTSFRTTWNSSDTTLLSTAFGETTYHTNVNDNITTLSTASSSPTTNTLNVTSQELNSTSGTSQTQAGIVSQAWVYTGIGIGIGVLIVLVLSGLIIYINRTHAHSYKLHSTTNGYMLKDKGSDDRMSASRMAYIDSSDF